MFEVVVIRPDNERGNDTNETDGGHPPHVPDEPKANEKSETRDIYAKRSVSGNMDRLVSKFVDGLSCRLLLVDPELVSL